MPIRPGCKQCVARMKRRGIQEIEATHARIPLHSIQATRYRVTTSAARQVVLTRFLEDYIALICPANFSKLCDVTAVLAALARPKSSRQCN